MAEKIGRDAFLYLAPKPTTAAASFAQCGPCRMFVPEAMLGGEMKGDRCIAHGSFVAIDDDDSCGFYLPWPTPDGSPVRKVQEDHAAELMKIIPGSVSPEESGLVDRRVQCHRCKFAENRATRCRLYATLELEMPRFFALGDKIEPNACCNAQTPREERSEPEPERFLEPALTED